LVESLLPTQAIDDQVGGEVVAEGAHQSGRFQSRNLGSEGSGLQHTSSPSLEIFPQSELFIQPHLPGFHSLEKSQENGDLDHAGGRKSLIRPNPGKGAGFHLPKQGSCRQTRLVGQSGQALLQSRDRFSPQNVTWQCRRGRIPKLRRGLFCPASGGRLQQLREARHRQAQDET
jgi:hypothetical protein